MTRYSDDNYNDIFDSSQFVSRLPRIELLKRMRLTRYRWLLIGSLLAIIIVGGSGASMGVLTDGSSDMTKVRADRYCDSSDG